MVLGKLPVPGRPTTLDKCRARAYCTSSRCKWGLFGHFFSRLSFLFSFFRSLGDCLKGLLSPQKPTSIYSATSLQQLPMGQQKSGCCREMTKMERSSI